MLILMVSQTIVGSIASYLCAVKYSASPNNYYSFRFYEINSRKRNTYVTHGLNKKLIAKYNDNRYRNIFENKIKFAKTFVEFYGREWISLNDLSCDDFKKFIKNKEVIVYKPVDLAQGQGIKKLVINKFDNYMQMWNYLTTNYNNNASYSERLVK
jgi:hypothetical protein